MKRGIARGIALTVLVLGVAGCRGKANSGEDAQVKALGTIEVTARLVEVPEGAVFYRELYSYATILKFEVVSVHRGALQKGAMIFVAHYNPWKPRAEAADKRITGIGGDAKTWKGGTLYRMALESPLDEYYMGGVVDKYFGKHEGTVYWAVWTNAAD